MKLSILILHYLHSTSIKKCNFTILKKKLKDCSSNFFYENTWIEFYQKKLLLFIYCSLKANKFIFKKFKFN